MLFPIFLLYCTIFFLIIYDFFVDNSDRSFVDYFFLFSLSMQNLSTAQTTVLISLNKKKTLTGFCFRDTGNLIFFEQL